MKNLLTLTVMTLSLWGFQTAQAMDVVVAESDPAMVTALEIKETDQMVGDAAAPITIIEYASMTCGHCADFHNKTYPVLKEKLVDTGRAKFVFRELPWDNRALAVSMVARCAPEEDFSKFVSAFFSTHETWVRSGDFMESIKQIARLGGMKADDVDACLKNPDVNDLVRKSRQEAVDVLKVTGTPTLFINGHRLNGALPAGEILDYVAQLEAKLK